MQIEVNRGIMELNDSYAAENRALFDKNTVLVLNILGSPGAGKTSLLEALLPKLQTELRTAVIEGDLATAKDAQRIAACGVPVVQINTGGGCHLDAKMIGQVLPGFELEKLDLLLIENVGNLVCPAGFDLGEDMKLLLISVAEGADKPAKYPATFLAAKMALINKIDMLPFTNIDLQDFHQEIKNINPQLEIFNLCCRPGNESGLQELAERIYQLAAAKKLGGGK